MRKGFTLVELSIVLVIIGLLIGGILAAKSMIQSAKINSQIKQFEQFDVAVSNFQTKYNSLPGDSDKFSQPGDYNGMLRRSYELTYPGIAGISNGMGSRRTTVNYSEAGVLFWHLTQAGMIKDQYSYATDYYDVPGVTAPKAKIGVENSIIYGSHFINEAEAGTVHAAEVSPYQRQGHYWILCPADITGLNNRFCDDVTTNASLTPSEAGALDSKMDDGKPESGNVYAVLHGGESVGRSGTQTCVDNHLNPQAYRFSNTNPACGLKVKMLLNNGS